MRRKLLALATALALTLAVAPPVAATASSCDFDGGFSNSLIAGEYWNPPNGLASPGVFGVRAFVWIPSASNFTNCDPTHEGNDGAAAWIGIQPDSTNTDGNSQALVQMGIVVCNNVINSVGSDVCNYNNNPRFFYAAAGCGTYVLTAFDLNLGVAQRQAWHELQISFDPQTDKWDFKVGGTQIGTIDDDNPVVSCWLGNNRTSIMTVIAGEQQDHGDSLGSGGGETKRLTFFDVEAKNAAGWFDLFHGTNNASDCAYNDMPTGSPRFTCWNPYYPTGHYGDGFPGSNIAIQTDR